MFAALAIWPSLESIAVAADEARPFSGAKSAWREGFDRFDYVIDERTLEIEPYARDLKEGFGVLGPAKGKADAS